MTELLKARCGDCGRKLRIPAEHAGRRIQCPNCEAMMILPSRAEVEAMLPERYVIPPLNLLGEPPTKGPDIGDSVIINISSVADTGDGRSLAELLAGDSPPELEDTRAAGYEIKDDNRLVLLDAHGTWLADIAGLVLGLSGTRASPICIDLTVLGELELPTVRRVAQAALAAQVAGKPTELLTTAEQLDHLRAISLDGLCKIRQADPAP